MKRRSLSISPQWQAEVSPLSVYLINSIYGARVDCEEEHGGSAAAKSHSGAAPAHADPHEAAVDSNWHSHRPVYDLASGKSTSQLSLSNT